MPEDLEGQITTLRDRLDTSSDISDADREVIQQFHDRIRPRVPQDIGRYRERKLLRSLVILAERHGQLATALEDRGAAEDIKQWIDDAYENEESNRDMRSIFFHFARVVTPGQDAPESIAWIPTTYRSTYDKTPDPREILTWSDDVKPMLQAATNTRDKAMVAIAFDAGLRGGEFKNLERRDLQDHDHGLKVTVEGKRGRRSVLLVPSVTYVTDWLADHPSEDPNAPLWSKLSKPEAVSDSLIYKQFRKLGERADIDKPVTLTNFRKSSAAYLARRNVNQAHIEDHHGWVRGSDAAARYVQVFGEDTDREVARAHGVELDASEEPETVQSVPCPRCEEMVAPHREFCGACSQAVDHSAHRLVERTLETFEDMGLEADDLDEAQKFMAGAREIRRNPDRLDTDTAHELLHSVEER